MKKETEVFVHYMKEVLATQTVLTIKFRRIVKFIPKRNIFFMLVY